MKVDAGSREVLPKTFLLGDPPPPPPRSWHPNASGLASSMTMEGEGDPGIDALLQELEDAEAKDNQVSVFENKCVFLLKTEEGPRAGDDVASAQRTSPRRVCVVRRCDGS